jgi:hypothetical protein
LIFTASDTGVYSYSRQAPTNLADPLGLFVIDPSCDCERQLSDNIPRGLGKARGWAKSASCTKALDRYPEVKNCVARLFNPDQQGREPVIRCHSKNPPEGGFCGSNTPLMITTAPAIHLFPGNPNCPRFNPKIGIGATIFHETLHICGIGSEAEAAEVTLRCTGYSARP